MEYMVVNEGKAKLLVPRLELYLRPDGRYEPSWAPVFYNPRAISNRDLSVIALATIVKHFKLNSLTVADVLAGTGVRGIRYVLEVPNVEWGLINDIDPKAVEIMKNNVLLNDLGNKVRVYGEDANELLYRLKREGVKLIFIDVDPYGSPVPYVRSSLWCVVKGGFVGFTATDVAALSGSKSHAGLRRYDTRLAKTDFGFEVGLRVLLGYIARRAAEADRYIEPVLSVFYDYYYRVVIYVGKGAKKAQEMLKDKVGYIFYCRGCLFRTYDREISLDVLKCPICGSSTEFIGPLWISDLNNHEVINGAIEKLMNEYNYLPTLKSIHKLLTTIKDEVNVPFYYNLITLASKLRISIPKVVNVIHHLREIGYKASRTHFIPTGIKTDANYNTIVNIVKHSLSEKSSQHTT